MKDNKKLSGIAVKGCWKLLILSLLFLLSLPVPALTADFFVATGGDNTNDCQTELTPCLTIGAAVGKAAASDTIRIGAGTYNEYVSLNKNLSLIGAGIDKTFLDGGGTGRVIYTYTNTVSLAKLTVQNGVTASNGGGISNGGTLTLDQVEVVNCNGYLGGAIENSGGVTTIANSILRGNDTLQGGSAIYNTGGGQVTIEKTTISGNSAPATKTVLHNQGGGIMNMTNVTISSNTADTILVSTAGSTVTVLNSTISNNSGAIYNYGTINCQNTIISSNNSGGNSCGLSLTSLGNNLEDNNSCGFNGPGDLINTAPLLLPLANNGGYTMTHALDRESPAIDSGDNASCPLTDQRGEPRPFDGDKDDTATCDIGAFELSKVDLASPWALFLPAIINFPQD